MPFNCTNLSLQESAWNLLPERGDRVCLLYFCFVLYLCKYVNISETERGIVPLCCINDVL